MNYVRTKQSYKNPAPGIGVGEPTYQRGRADNRILRDDARDSTVLVTESDIKECQQLWLTVKSAAKYLGVSTDFIRDLISDGLRYRKVRHTIFIKKDELDAYIDESE